MKRNNHARSCDSMIAAAPASATGNIIYAKNSDRPLNEAQPLVYFPPADHEPGEIVQTSFIKVPQVAHTYGVIGSKLDTFFGCEHGINEWGLVIGNEQVECERVLVSLDALYARIVRFEVDADVNPLTHCSSPCGKIGCWAEA